MNPKKVGFFRVKVSPKPCEQIIFKDRFWNPEPFHAFGGLMWVGVAGIQTTSEVSSTRTSAEGPL